LIFKHLRKGLLSLPIEVTLAEKIKAVLRQRQSKPVLAEERSAGKFQNPANSWAVSCQSAINVPSKWTCHHKSTKVHAKMCMICIVTPYREGWVTPAQAEDTSMKM
jgi:hypothetical protein